MKKARSTFVFTKSITNPKSVSQTQNYAQIVESGPPPESGSVPDQLTYGQPTDGSNSDGSKSDGPKLGSGLPSGSLGGSVFKVFNSFYGIRIISNCRASDPGSSNESSDPSSSDPGSNKITKLSKKGKVLNSRIGMFYLFPF